MPANRVEGNSNGTGYFAGADSSSPIISPMIWPNILAQFPPSLLITGTRSSEMSSLIDANNKLAKVGVEARLYIWDGLEHGFLLNSDLPESREAYDIIVKFFDTHLRPE